MYTPHDRDVTAGGLCMSFIIHHFYCITTELAHMRAVGPTVNVRTTRLLSMMMVVMAVKVEVETDICLVLMQHIYYDA
jgi:hypothetical protein